MSEGLHIAETDRQPEAPPGLKPSSLHGQCLLFSNSPVRSVKDGWVLPEGEVAYVAPGKQFTVFSQQDGDPKSEVYLAINDTWVKGPLLWADQFTELDVDKHLLPDLAAAAEHKLKGSDHYLAIGGVIGLSFALCAYLLHLVAVSAVVFLLFVFVVTCVCAFLGVLVAFALESENISGFRRAAKLVNNPIVKSRTFKPISA